MKNTNKNSSGHIFFLIIASLFLSACDGCSDKKETTSKNTGSVPISEIPNSTEEVKAKLEIIDLKVGDGKTAEAGQNVRVHYTGTLEDGTKFDSSKDRDTPFNFNLGRGEVIKDWDQGVEGMKVGGSRKLVIPSHLAYGKRGVTGVIPPNATLVFEIDLLETK